MSLLSVAMISNVELAVTLNDLIAVCYNGEKGYRVAFSHVRSARLQSLLSTYAEQRAGFIAALRAEVEKLNAIPESSGDVAGSTHRLWMHLKSILPTSDEAILAECLVGEKAALEVYEQVRAKILPVAIQNMVDEQYEAIRAARDRLRALQAMGTRDETG